MTQDDARDVEAAAPEGPPAAPREQAPPPAGPPGPLGPAPTWVPPTQQPPPHVWAPSGYGTAPFPAGRWQPTGWTPPAPRARGRVPLWLLPIVCLLALMVGVVGGVAGSAVHDWVVERDGGSSKGLAGVDVVTEAPLPAENGSIAAVAQQVLPSTVQIIAAVEGRDAGATGSGFVLDRQGHVITNNHVVAGAADGGRIEVIDQDGERFEATVVGRSPVYDIAVLHAPNAQSLEPASLGSSRRLLVGESVVAIGSPLGLTSTVTSGIVSALDRPVTTGGNAEDESSFINAVQTDAAINPGNSGGPLVDLRGQVVGVNSAIATTGGGLLGGESGNIGVGFAIPIEQVKITADQILRTGKARYPVIGARVQTGATDARGAVIESVIPGTPAEDGGLRDGDVVVAVEGKRVTDGIELIVTIRTYQPGETLAFTVRRDGAERTVTITLDGEVG